MRGNKGEVKKREKTTSDPLHLQTVSTFLQITQYVLPKIQKGRYKQEALPMHRDHATRSVTRNNKSDLQTHSRSLVFVPFDRQGCHSKLTSEK